MAWWRRQCRRAIRRMTRIHEQQMFERGQATASGVAHDTPCTASAHTQAQKLRSSTRSLVRLRLSLRRNMAVRCVSTLPVLSGAWPKKRLPATLSTSRLGSCDRVDSSPGESSGTGAKWLWLWLFQPARLSMRRDTPAWPPPARAAGSAFESRCSRTTDRAQ